MLTPLSSLIPSNSNASQLPPAVAPGGTFDQTLQATLNPLQQVPLVGTMFRDVGEHPLQILGAAARGFFTGGPVGAVASAGLSVLSDQVSGDSTLVPRTEAMLKAYGPLAGS